MKKKKLLYVSPFQPQRSGISDYSEVLVYALSSLYDITLLIDDYTLSNERLYRDFEVKIYGKDTLNFSLYDYKIYNIGNNPFFHDYIYELCLKELGMVILHDCVLYYLITGYYSARNCLYSKLYEIGGAKAIEVVKMARNKEQKNILEYKEIASELPLNKELAKSGNKIMVHSEFAKNMIFPYMENKSQLCKINMIQQTGDIVNIIERKELFDKFGIPKDKTIIASFGYVASTKLNDIVCRTVRSLNGKYNTNICYIMVGECDWEEVKKYIDNKCIFKTGFVNLNEFNSFLKYSDIVINMRHPSMGETSAAMIRILEYGKACITNNGGWFSELPDDVVCKIELNDIEDSLEKAIVKLIKDIKYKNKLESNALHYIESEYSNSSILNSIKNFLE